MPSIGSHYDVILTSFSSRRPFLTSYRKIAIKSEKNVRRCCQTTHFLALEQFFHKTRFTLSIMNQKTFFIEHLVIETRKKNFENCADVSKNMTSPQYVILRKHIFSKSFRDSLHNAGSRFPRKQIFWILWSFS